VWGRIHGGGYCNFPNRILFSMVMLNLKSRPLSLIFLSAASQAPPRKCPRMERPSIERPSSGKSRPTLLIADDHVIFAETLKVYLENKYPVVGVVPDGRALIEAALRLKPDITIADVAMPLLNGLDAVRRIKEQAPNMKFIFLTMRDDANLAAAALELGAVGFVLKQSAGSELLEAIDHVLHGESYLTRKLRAEDWVAAKARARQFSKELTPRQRDIVQLFGEGRTIKQIADVLNLSEKTVEFHKHHIMQALNLNNNAELILFALKEGLISVDAEFQEEKRKSSCWLRINSRQNSRSLA
jgi:DNA-binding NarL/FixJ family response regulator